MQVQIHAKNMTVKPPLREYIEKKVEKLDRYLPNIVEAKVDLRTQRQKSGGDRAVMQLTVRNQRGTILRVEDKSQADMKAAVDIVLDKMYRRIRSYKGKQRRKGGERFAELEPELAAAELLPGEAEDAAATDETKMDVVRRKIVPVHPMTEEEAIEQMELLGHDFFMFLNATTNTVCVTYLREEGNYGLLEPDFS